MSEKIFFTRGVPPPEAFPTDELGACFEAAIRDDASVVLQYGQQPGYAPLRRELAKEEDAGRGWAFVIADESGRTLLRVPLGATSKRT